MGTADDADLPGLFRSASVIVVPSVEKTCYGRNVRVSELLGLVALEAMACGTPVIASRVGGLPEVVQDGVTGFLVPPGDVNALRERVDQLLGDPALAHRLGANAREVVLERFSRVAKVAFEPGSAWRRNRARSERCGPLTPS